MNHVKDYPHLCVLRTSPLPHLLSVEEEEASWRGLVRHGCGQPALVLAEADQVGKHLLEGEGEEGATDRHTHARTVEPLHRGHHWDPALSCIERCS